MADLARKTTRYLMQALVCLSVFANAAVAADGSEKELLFRVLLDDKQIGFHSFRLAENAGRKTIEINADFDVTFFAIPVYRYDHSNREVWNGGCLETIVSSTDDNGDEYSVAGEMQGDFFKVAAQGAQNRLEAPCVMTFAYWNRDFLEQSYLLNAQTGEYLPVSIDYEGVEQLQIGPQSVEAARYNLRNEDKALDITVWYGESNGEWLSLESKVGGGRTLRYLPATGEKAKGGSTVVRLRESQK